MKSRILTLIVAMTFLTALVIPVRLAAQDNQHHEHEKHHHYKLIDIGTFGGPASQVIPGVNAGPIISKRGTAVGLSATSVHTSSHSHPFVCYGVSGDVPYIFHGFKWQGDDVIDLGSLPPTAENCSEAQGVNGKGEIVLQSENGRIDPVTGINEIRGVLWKEGKLEGFGTFGGHNSLASQINSRGQVAGAADNTISDPFSLYY